MAEEGSAKNVLLSELKAMQIHNEPRGRENPDEFGTDFYQGMTTVFFNKEGDVTIKDATLSLPITQPPSEFFDAANSKFVILTSGSDDHSENSAVDSNFSYGIYEADTVISILGTRLLTGVKESREFDENEDYEDGIEDD